MVFDKDDELGPLHAAARDGNLTGVREALRRFGATTRDLWGQTALHWAASVEVAKTLVAAGGSPADVDPTGDTPLHWAAEHGNTKIVEFLIAQQVDVNASNHRGDAALHAAAASRNFETVRCLLDASADPKVVNTVGETAMHVAARTGEVNVVKSLVMAGGKVAPCSASPSQGFDRGEEQVKVAASNGSTPLHELIKYLIQRNADVNAMTSGGRAVLQDAVKRKAHTIIEELCDKGAEVACLGREAAVKGQGWTALHLAGEAGSLRLCQAVVKKGAAFYDPEALTAAGHRPADVARLSAYANDKVVKFLEDQVRLKKLAQGGPRPDRSPTRQARPGPAASASPEPAAATRSRRGSLAHASAQGQSASPSQHASRRGSVTSSRGSSKPPSGAGSRRGSVSDPAASPLPGATPPSGQPSPPSPHKSPQASPRQAARTPS